MRGIKLEMFGLLSSSDINFIWTNSGGSDSSSNRNSNAVRDFLIYFSQHKNIKIMNLTPLRVGKRCKFELEIILILNLQL